MPTTDKCDQIKALVQTVEKNQGGRVEALKLLTTLKAQYTHPQVMMLLETKSQLNQDLFVLSELDYKKNGFFVEFGATDGVELSNTYALEKFFGWTGILAEPAKSWHQKLKENRNCWIEENCVWSESNKLLEFNETALATVSTISEFTNLDRMSPLRTGGTKYNVTTISLTDLLDKYNAPLIIDYLSIDTEGSEFEILNHFNFNKYKFKVITCEHNFSPLRSKLYDLLLSNGYMRKFENISDQDDWYVLQ